MSSTTEHLRPDDTSAMSISDQKILLVEASAPIVPPAISRDAVA